MFRPPVVRSADLPLTQPKLIFNDDDEITGMTDDACLPGDVYFRVPGRLPILVILPGESNLLPDNVA